MRPATASALGLTTLASIAGCGPVETAQAEAIGSCQLKARDLFPAFAQAFAASGNQLDREQAGDIDPALEAAAFGPPMEFRFVSTGQFVVATTSAPEPSLELACSGDFNERRLTSVRFNGQIRRPEADAEWSF